MSERVEEVVEQLLAARRRRIAEAPYAADFARVQPDIYAAVIAGLELAAGECTPMNDPYGECNAAIRALAGKGEKP